MSITKFPFSYVLFGIAAVKVMRFSQEQNTMTGQTPLLRHIQSFMSLSMLVCKMAQKHWWLTKLDGWEGWKNLKYVVRERCPTSEGAGLLDRESKEFLRLPNIATCKFAFAYMFRCSDVCYSLKNLHGLMIRN